jgi:hypothetical protein
MWLELEGHYAGRDPEYLDLQGLFFQPTTQYQQ